MYQALAVLQRAGWVEKGVENPETVKEYTQALIQLGLDLQDELKSEEFEGLITMLEVHDWPEAICGDEVILELNLDDRKVVKAIKFENEKYAMEEICKNIPNGEELFASWIRFETSDDPAATFGRQLDKYQAVEKALEYEQQQRIALFDEFLAYSINFIDHPILLQKLLNLKSLGSDRVNRVCVTFF